MFVALRSPNAQPSNVPVIGFLNPGSSQELQHFVQAFLQGLRENGYVEGRNIVVEYRWGNGDYASVDALAKELVSRQVKLIATTGNLGAAAAAMRATSTTPIVFGGGGDPIEFGLVDSLAKPGRNATGITNLSGVLDTKRLQILHDLMPGATRISYLVNPNSAIAASQIKGMEAATEKTRSVLQIVRAGKETEFDSAFRMIVQSRAQFVIVAADAMFTAQRDRIVLLAARHALPAFYAYRDFSVAGGLMSYGPDLGYMHRQVGVYAGRILKGARPSELPVLQADKFELVVNLKTAKKLGINIHREFLTRVDEVIE